MKKFIFYVTSFFLYGTAYAEVADFNGLYFGVGAGGVDAVSHNEGVLTSNLGAGAAGLVLTKMLKEKETAIGFEGDLMAGYQVVNQKYLLGIEGIVGFQRFHIKNTATVDAIAGDNPVAQVNVAPTLKTSDPFVALSFKPGFFISSTLCYGLVGAKIARFKVVSEGSHSQLGGIIGSSATSNDKTFTKVGVALGLGMETFLVDKMTLGLNYQGVYYGKFSNLNAFAPFDGDGGILNVVNKNKLYTHALLIRFNYYV